jgi:hypothetical protein
MPFTVSCAACNSRFLLGDDLFRRKVSGKVVTVRCRNCNAEISVDATEPATLPSQEPPPRRARPAPPRPKQNEGDAAATPLPASALLSIWDAAEKRMEAPRKPAPPPNNRDFIDDVEEAPPSSSDAPSLNALTHETNPKTQKSTKKAPDDFLVNLSAGTAGMLGAPTIDVTGLGSPQSQGVEELLEVEATELTPRAGTIPLFDMSAVLPVANNGSKSIASSLAPSHVDLTVVEMPRTPSSDLKRRERKYVVAPTARQDAPAPKTRRSGAAVWFVLVAAAAAIVLVIGLRGHMRSHRALPEPQPAEHPPSVTEAPPANDIAPSAEIPATTEANSAANAADPARPGKAQGSVSPTMNAAGTTPKEPASQAIEKPAEAEKPTPQAPKPEPAEPGTDFDRAAAVAALKSAAGEAAACRKDADPSGTATLTITFAPSGRVTTATIQGPPFAGTPTGGCIANSMRRAHVPAFSGERVTVTKTIVIE